MSFLTFFKNVFSCKRTKKIVCFNLYNFYATKKQATNDSSINKEKSPNFGSPYNKLLYIIKETKKTKFGTIRFIIPEDFFDNLLNNFQEDIQFRNEIFLNSKRNKLKKGIDLNKIVFVIYEIMEFILSYFRIDFIILVPYSNIEKTLDFENIEIYLKEEFREINFTYKKIDIESTYFKYKDLSIKKNNNYLGDSTNELLTAPRNNLDEKNKEKDNKNDSTTIRRINTESGYISPLNNNKLLEENDINQANISDAKLSINKISRNMNDNNINGIVINQKNDGFENDKIERSEDNDIDELHSDEKFHKIKNKFYNKYSLEKFYLKKQNNETKEFQNKNEEDDKKNENEKQKKIENKKENEIEKENRKKKENEENKYEQELKKYTFNDNQLTINLSSYERESINPIGIFNPSIYCFMICILQALLSIPELNFYFLSKYYKVKNERNEYDNNTRICDAFHEFIKLYLLGKNHIDIPRDLKSICIRLLGGMRMHDCQEFFVCFLEALQAELNTNEKIKNEENATMQLKWISYRKANNSFIDSVFTGLMRSTVQCKKCDFKSYTYDPFIDLSVSINKNKNLGKCLNQYFENEKIDCGYKCDKCKQVSKVSKLIKYKKNINIYNYIFQAIKKLDIMIPPPILTIQFKRFKDDGRKINKPVEFQETIDIKK